VSLGALCPGPNGRRSSEHFLGVGERVIAELLIESMLYPQLGF
jgi:hypothetical protein